MEIKSDRASQHIRVMNLPKFNRDEFFKRWEQARKSALYNIVGSDTENISEDEFIKRVSIKIQEAVLKKIFENSRALGLSLVRYLSATWDLSDIREVLAQSKVPCLQGKWTTGQNAAEVLKRQGCRVGREQGSFYCQYWREAIDGLVIGLGEAERFARHGSINAGDDECIDVFFSETAVPTSSVNRWSPVPEAMSAKLVELCGIFNARMNINATFKGYSEGTLYYEIAAVEKDICGPGGKIIHEYLATSVNKIFPEVKLQDVSPRAVMN